MLPTDGTAPVDCERGSRLRYCPTMTHPDEPIEPRQHDLFDILGLWILALAGALLLLYQLLSAAFWLAGPSARIWGLALAPVLGIVVPMFALLRRLRLPLVGELLLFPMDRRQFAAALVASAGALPLAYAAGAVNAHFVPPDPSYFEFYRDMIPTNALDLIGGALALVVLVPLGEEIVFRAMVLPVMARHMPPFVAAILVGLLFAVAHLQPWVVLPITVLGIVLSWITLRTGSVIPAWLGHALFNLVAYVELLRTGDVETGELDRLATNPLLLLAGAVLLTTGLRMLRPVNGRARRPEPDRPAPTDDTGREV